MTPVTYNFYPKYILDSNGQFEWERTTDIMCHCGHKQSKHPDAASICLDKSKADLTGTCICEEFMSSNQTVSTFSNIPKKKLPRKEHTADLLVKEDQKRTNNDNFMRQYGII
jgi:hypothetical protein